MPRETGKYRTSVVMGEAVRAFVPHDLPPDRPPLDITGPVLEQLGEAQAALARLRVAGGMVPDAAWFVYGFVRREAVMTSQIEGTQATLRDVLTFDATGSSERPADVEEVCNYVEALRFARREMSRPKGLPLSTRLLCEAHRRLMKGVRGEQKLPGEIRRSQNWIGGTRPGTARFVPPPPDEVPELMARLERWLHSSDSLPPLVRIGLAHVQFESIHPFLDGNGRIGRLLVALLVEHWGLMEQPVLYVSVAIRRRQGEYYERLSAVRTAGDWEGWTAFFLGCVREAADDGVRAATRLAALLQADRERLAGHASATLPAVRLLDRLPTNPMMTQTLATRLLRTTKPTALKAIGALEAAGILRETTGRKRDRVYAYEGYLRVLSADAE